MRAASLRIPEWDQYCMGWQLAQGIIFSEGWTQALVSRWPLTLLLLSAACFNAPWHLLAALGPFNLSPTPVPASCYADSCRWCCAILLLHLFLLSFSPTGQAGVYSSQPYNVEATPLSYDDEGVALGVYSHFGSLAGFCYEQWTNANSKVYCKELGFKSKHHGTILLLAAQRQDLHEA